MEAHKRNDEDYGDIEDNWEDPEHREFLDDGDVLARDQVEIADYNAQIEDDPDHIA